MYSESATIKYHDSIPQSTRLEFLAEMAVALESSVEFSSASGFSIDLHANGKAQVVIWHPWKRDVLWSKLCEGNRKGLYQVTRPKNFSDWTVSDPITTPKND